MVRSGGIFTGAGLAAEASAPLPPGAEQMAMELQRPAFGAVDELVDRLVAQTAVPRRPCFSRPAICSGDQQRSSLSMTWRRKPSSWLSLLQPPAPLPSLVLRGQREVAGVVALLAEVVAADLAMDGRAVPAEFPGDGRDRHLGVEQAEDRAALGEIELPIGSRHEGGSVVQAAEKPTKSHFGIETTPPTS